MQIMLDKSNVGLYATKIADRQIIIFLLIVYRHGRLDFSVKLIYLTSRRFLDFNMLTIVLTNFLKPKTYH